ncbi:MAG: hypothetical protein IJW40_06720 [Clostridia bacterium]|nr:hypothetical protein [Clostridia bacterium]
MNKQRYLDLIELAVSAYSEEHIARYIASVRTNGLREHGYPRLVANIGILLAHGRGMHRLSYFPDMMTLCCDEVPTARARAGGNAGNDFSVKELVMCLLELERAGIFDRSLTDAWRKSLSSLDPYTTYSCIAPVPVKIVGNWAAFSAASEQTRVRAGMTEQSDFIYNQVRSQLLVFDENGMYRDPHEPMVYDMVTRLQLAVVLANGYDGEDRATLEELMHTSALPTLYMQSVSGEIPFGGRSNQFLHNETFYAALCEYYAALYHQKGDDALAGQFKSAARLAVDSLTPWLSEGDMHHIKNRYPQDSMIGCEGYAYFDKYMVTMGSWAYLAYFFADDDIAERPCPAEIGGYVWSTSPHFHKTFLSAGGYTVELESNADFTYDSNGIGRIHKVNAPGALCLSVPFPCAPTTYTLSAPNPSPLAISGGVQTEDGSWQFTSAKGTLYTLTEQATSTKTASITYTCTLPCGDILTHEIELNADGVTLTVTGKGQVGIELPIFVSDGAGTTNYAMIDDTLVVSCDEWFCRTKTDGTFSLCCDENEKPLLYQNRNGTYHRALASGSGSVRVHITIEKA